MTTETSFPENNEVECSNMKEVQDMTESHSQMGLSHTHPAEQPQRPQTVVISQRCNQIVLQLIHNQSEEEEESSCSDEQNTIVLYVDGENNNVAAEATPLDDCQTILQIANQRAMQVATKDSEEGLQGNATNGEDEQEGNIESELELSNSEADLKLATHSCKDQETQKSITENEVVCEDLAKGTRYSLIQIDGISKPESLDVDIEEQAINSAAQTEAAVVVLHNAEALEDNAKESISMSTRDEGRTIIKISEDGSYIQAEDGAIIHITDSQSSDGSDNSQDDNSETYYILEVEEREDGVKEYRCLHSNEIVVQVANKSKEVEVQTPEDPSADSGTSLVLMPNRNILSYYRSLGHYKCNQCDKVFGLKGNLKQHMALHTNEKPFKCNICEQTFTLKGNMKKHLQLHNGDKKFQCKLCEKVFSTKGNLKQHVLNHDGSKPFGCRICHKAFRIKGNLTKHMALHEERPYKCDICFMPFTGEKRLAAHMLRHDSQYAVKVETDEIVLCPVCNESFPYSSNLSVHFKIEHSNQLLRYKCNLCSKLCKERGAYLRHKAVHSRPFKCEICDKTFPVACILQRHLICHSEEKPFKCAFCGRAFSRFGNLERHNIRNSRKTLYSCHICGDKFEVGCSLKKHFSEKHNEGSNGTPTKPFSCNICEKTFMLETALNAHLRKHEQVSTPTCAFCGTSFPDKIALKEHSEIHKGEKIQKCYICSQMFNELDLLKRHFQSEHAEKLNKCDICGREFLLAKDLKRHMKIHKPERDHKCIECGKEFTYSFGLTRHMKTHRKEDKVHKCETCGKTFSLIDYLKRHVKTHNKTHQTKSLISEGEGCQCDICSETFALEVDLERHMNCHESESSPKCVYSSENPQQVNDSAKLKKPSATRNKSTSSVESGNSRKTTKEVKSDSGKSKKNASQKNKSEEIVVKSENSSENSDKVNDLMQSKENACSKSKPGKTFISTKKKTKRTTRQEIIEIESDDMTHICGICGMKFKQVSSLRRHEKTHSTKSRDAEKGTNPKTSVAYKRAPKREQSCTCSVCGKCFMAESILKRHSNIHKKHQPYRCEECGKCFASEEELINHIDGIHCGGHLKDHSNTAAKEKRRKRSWKCHNEGQCQEDVKPFLCTICAKVCSSSEDLERHIKTCLIVD